METVGVIIGAIVAIAGIGGFFAYNRNRTNKTTQKNITIHGDGKVVGGDDNSISGSDNTVNPSK